MHRRVLPLRAVVLLVAAIAYAADPLATQPAGTHEPTPEELAWLKDNAIVLRTVEAGGSLDDLEPLKTLIGDAHIVALGEGTHGTREFFQMKHRLVEFLAREMGFTIFSIEANLPEAYRLNDFVLKGMGDPKELIAGMYFWTWNTQEVLDMVEWMRKYNKSGQGRIEFTGFDMQTPDVGRRYRSGLLGQGGARLHRNRRPGIQRVVLSTCRRRSRQRDRQRHAARLRGSWQTHPLHRLHQDRGPYRRLGGPVATRRRPDWLLEVRRHGGPWPQGHHPVDTLRGRGRCAQRGHHGRLCTRHSGYGTAWFDTLQVEIDGKPFACRGRYDFDFESGAPRGFHVSGQAYTTSGGLHRGPYRPTQPAHEVHGGLPCENTVGLGLRGRHRHISPPGRGRETRPLQRPHQDRGRYARLGRTLVACGRR